MTSSPGCDSNTLTWLPARATGRQGSARNIWQTSICETKCGRSGVLLLTNFKRIAEGYKSDFEIAKTREETVQKNLDDLVSQSNSTNQAQVTLRELESNAQNYRALADNFLQLYMISVQQQSFPATEARLITEASAALKPSYPKLWLVTLISVVGGGFMAFGVGMLRDLNDRVFRTGAQAEKTLGIECLAVLPMIDGCSQVCEGFGASPRRCPRNIATNGILSHVVDVPFSRFTEGVRVDQGGR